MNRRYVLWLLGVTLAPPFCWLAAVAEDPPAWVDTSGQAPSDAVVIFDGKKTDMLAGPDGGAVTWPIEDGALVCTPQQQPQQQGLWTRLHFRDAQIHVEFSTPASSKRGESKGNSGVYLHGLFEQQILDSYQNDSRPIGMVGALYGFRPPLANGARPPGQWQSYDIVFKAPRRNAEGQPIEPGSVTTLLNGVLVQWNTEFTKRKSVFTPLYFRTTPYAVRIRESLLKTGCGPLQLQDHSSPVRFRNIWIRPLDDKAFVFEADELKD